MQEPQEKLILVLDDDRAILELLTQALEMEGYQVFTAEHGLQGLDRLNELWADRGKIPDLIVCDVMMPLMDGVQLCNSLRESRVYAAVPVILITAAANATYLGRCRYSAVVRKPFDLDGLLGVITELLLG